MRILLLEDEDSIRSALTRACERDGHTVRPAACLAEARAILATWTPELAVSDLKLPDGDGLDLVGSLGIPFVMLSGYATFDDAVRAMRCGAVDFLTKPVAIKDVRAAIARAGQSAGGALTASWDSPAAAAAAIGRLLHRLPGPLARLAATELAQAAPAGRLSGHSDAAGTRFWLDAAADWSVQTDRSAWLRANGIALLTGDNAAVAIVPPEPALPYDEERELLWNPELVAGRVVQAHGWVSAGAWILAALRTGAGPFAGLATTLIARLESCGVSVRTAPSALARPGLDSEERAGLVADGDLGAPVA